MKNCARLGHKKCLPVFLNIQLIIQKYIIYRQKLSIKSITQLFSMFLENNTLRYFC